VAVEGRVEAAHDAVGGNLIPGQLPLSVLKSDPDGDAAAIAQEPATVFPR
jgi:hypothetical protein